jgi:transcriptional regulator with XRE-family HTH domain
MYSFSVMGKEFLQIRKSLGLTQEQMAMKIGVRGNTVARWERDESKISEPMARFVLILAGAQPESKLKRGTKGK